MIEALLVVDIQNEYFPSGKFPLSKPVETAEATAKLIKKFRDDGKEVIFVQHVVPKAMAEVMPIFVEGTEGAEIHEIVKPLPTEKIVIKHEGSSFVRTDLKEYLQSKGITNLVVVGMMVHNCVNATVYSANEHGFPTIIVEECVDTLDQEFNGEIIKAEDIKKSFLVGATFLYTAVCKLDAALKGDYKYRPF